MATDLERFRDHCRKMASAQHTRECERRLATWIDHDRMSRWSWFAVNDPGPKPECAGCVSAKDRRLFKSLADEVDAYLTHDDAPLWEDA